MQRVQLYVADNEDKLQLVDLFGNETIQLTSSIQDVKDIGKVFTDYTQTFNVPASDTNNKIFRHYYNYFITEGGFDSRKKRRAELHINYTPFREGKIYLNSVKMKVNKPYAYELIFYGKTVTLKDLIGDDELTDLQYLQNYDHIYNAANVKEGFTNGLDFTVNSVSQEEAIIYPLITSKKRLFYHSGAVPCEDNTSGNLYHDTSNPSTIRGLEYTDLKPAIRVMHIIEAIEDKYSIEFTRDFFTIEDNPDDTPKNPAFKNLYMWINGVKDEFKDQEQSTYKNWTFLASGYTYDTSSDQISGATFSDGIVTFTKGVSGEAYDIKVATTPANNDTIFTVKFTEVDANGDKVSGGLDEEITKGKYVSGVTPNAIAVINPSDPVGTVKRIKIEYLSDEPLTFDSTITLLESGVGSGGAALSEIYNITNAVLSFSINLTSEEFRIMPKIKVIDFLTGLFKMFNLTAYYKDKVPRTDPEYGKIYVDTLDNFYSDAVNNPSGGTFDLDKYVDITEHTVDSVLPFTDINFQYDSKRTLLIQNHIDQFNEVFGDSEFNVRESFKDSVTGEYAIDRGTKYDIVLPFSHLKYERLLDLNSTPHTATRDTQIQWGYCASGEFEYTEGDCSGNTYAPQGDYESLRIEPLIFYAISEGPITNKKINWISTSTPTGIDTYYRPSNSNEDGNSTTPPAHTLNFDAEVDEWQGINYSNLEEPYQNLESQSLYYVFYKAYIESVFNPLKRMFKLTAHLPTRIVVDLRLNDQIKIRDRMFRINSITTDLGTGKSELELLNMFSIEIV